MRHRVLFVASLAFALAVPAAFAGTPTRVTVRVLAKGAKFLGTSLAGAHVSLHDARTGRLLAEGVTRGSTGDTGRIMKTAHVRPAVLSTEDAARFEATLDLDRPRLIEARAWGPLGQQAATVRVTSQQWVVPGRDVTGGDGWVLELPGFAVDVLDPPHHVVLAGTPRPVTVRAHVTMMCGCPIEPGGLWDADRIRVGALLYRAGEPAGEIALEYAGRTSEFAGTFTPDVPGPWEVVVYAWDPRDGNTGVDRTTLVVGPGS